LKNSCQTIFNNFPKFGKNEFGTDKIHLCLVIFCCDITISTCLQNKCGEVINQNVLSDLAISVFAPEMYGGVELEI